MSFSQKIYYNDKTFILTNDASAYIGNYPDAAAFQRFQGGKLKDFEPVLRALEQDTPGAVVEDASQEALLKKLQTTYKPIDAAGGIAYNEQGGILMIFRRGKWDLPKGKRDDDEGMEACALREVKEETGLTHLEITEWACNTYHIYSQYGKQLLKRTAWYKMKGTSKDKLQPQKEENILDAKWIAMPDVPRYAAKTYEAIKEVLTLAGVKLD